MSDTQAAKIGSSSWWSSQADKLIETGLSVLKYKLVGGDMSTGDHSNTDAQGSVMNSSMTDKLPWILGGLAVVGIAVILIKR